MSKEATLKMLRAFTHMIEQMEDENVGTTVVVLATHSGPVVLVPESESLSSVSSLLTVLATSPAEVLSLKSVAELRAELN